jgi:hypothetical protein
MCSWWWAEEPPEIFRASAEISKFKKRCILLAVICNCNDEVSSCSAEYWYYLLVESATLVSNILLSWAMASFHHVHPYSLTASVYTSETKSVTVIGNGVCKQAPTVYTHISMFWLFKQATHSPFFSSKCRLFHNAVSFDSPFFSSKCRLFHNAISLVPVIFTFNIQNVLKFKCETLVPKG